MIEINVNLLAVLVAAVANMLVGFAWYSPIMFAKPWVNLVGKDMKDMANPNQGYVLTALLSLVMAFVMAYVVEWANARSIVSGAMIGLVMWVGFVMTTQASNYIFEGRSRSLYIINVGYFLVSMMVMGAIVAVWR